MNTNLKISNFNRTIFGKIVKIISKETSPYLIIKVTTPPYAGIITTSLKNWEEDKEPKNGQYVAIPEKSINKRILSDETIAYRTKSLRLIRKNEKILAKEALSERGTEIIDCGILKTGTPYWIRESRKSAPNKKKGGRHFVIHNPIKDPHDGIHDTQVIHVTTQEEVVELINIGITFVAQISPYFTFALTGKGDRTRKHFHGHLILLSPDDLPPIVANKDKIIQPTEKKMIKSGIHHILTCPNKKSKISEFVESYIVMYNSTKNSSHWDKRLENDRWRIIGFCSVLDKDNVSWHIHQIWPRKNDRLPRLVDPFSAW